MGMNAAVSFLKSIHERKQNIYTKIHKDFLIESLEGKRNIYSKKCNLSLLFIKFEQYAITSEQCITTCTIFYQR